MLTPAQREARKLKQREYRRVKNRLAAQLYRDRKMKPVSGEVWDESQRMPWPADWFTAEPHCGSSLADPDTPFRMVRTSGKVFES